MDTSLDPFSSSDIDQRINKTNRQQALDCFFCGTNIVCLWNVYDLFQIIEFQMDYISQTFFGKPILCSLTRIYLMKVQVFYPYSKAYFLFPSRCITFNRALLIIIDSWMFYTSVEKVEIYFSKIDHQIFESDNMVRSSFQVSSFFQ